VSKLLLLSVWVALVGCKSGSTATSSTPEAKVAAPATRPAAKAIRINAGASTAYTDPQGNLWLADQGFADGNTADRGDIKIAGTNNPVIYRTEHNRMTSFSQPVPNGQYTVKLHFAETYGNVTQKGQRVFSVKVEDKEIKDLDIVARAGAPSTTLVETVNVTVADGKLDIIFTRGTQNPEINGIEIIPQ
jgi:endoglucanase